MTQQEIHLDPSWKNVLLEEFDQPYMRDLKDFLKSELAQRKTIFPRGSEYFAALNLTPYSMTKVVILGQDPYHGDGQAHGLSFSVKPGVPLPPSLKNIFKEIQDDLGIAPPKHGHLSSWAEQGVLLLNAILTVEKGKPQSHHKRGWENFTDRIIRLLNERKEPLAFLLWGAFAQSKAQYITNPDHLVLKAAHPSPFSAHNGFFGSRHFSKVNNFLMANNIEPINWDLSHSGQGHTTCSVGNVLAPSKDR